MKKWVLFAALMICILAVGCKRAEPLVVEIPTTTTTSAPVPVKRSILTGLPVETDGYPIAVSIPNDPTARPQQNIGAADVVYEMYAEGDITRMVAIYGDQKPEQVGPVRSGRVYMVDIVDDWNAAFVHYGGSDGGSYDLSSKIKKSKIKYDVDGMKTTANFQRVRGFTAPNNALFSMAAYAGTIESNPPMVSPLTFNEDGSYTQGTPVSEVVIPYSGSNKVRYVFQDGVFKRFIGDRAFTDRASEQQVTTNNVIVQEVARGGGDRSGHISLQMTGSGSATFYINGQRIQGTWERATSQVNTQYKDANGNLIIFAPGKTWVQVTTSAIEVTEA